MNACSVSFVCFLMNICNLNTSTVIGQAKILPAKYHTLNQFSLDMRRMIGNVIRYNIYNSDFRKQAISVLIRFEQKWGNEVSSASYHESTNHFPLLNFT